jgi:ribonuclease PH
MTDRGRSIEVQGKAAGESFEQAALDAMLNLAQAGIHQPLRFQTAVLDKWGIDYGTSK